MTTDIDVVFLFIFSPTLWYIKLELIERQMIWQRLIFSLTHVLIFLFSSAFVFHLLSIYTNKILIQFVRCTHTKGNSVTAYMVHIAYHIGPHPHPRNTDSYRTSLFPNSLFTITPPPQSFFLTFRLFFPHISNLVSLQLTVMIEKT